MFKTWHLPCVIYNSLWNVVKKYRFSGIHIKKKTNLHFPGEYVVSKELGAKVGGYLITPRSITYKKCNEWNMGNLAINDYL